MFSAPFLTIYDYFIFPKCEGYLSLENNERWKKIVLKSLQEFRADLLIMPLRKEKGEKADAEKNDKRSSLNGNIGFLVKILFDGSTDISGKDVSLESFIQKLRKIKIRGISRIKFLQDVDILESEADEVRIAEYQILTDRLENDGSKEELAEKLIRHIFDILEKNNLSSSDMSISAADPMQIIDSIVQNSKEVDNLTKHKLLNELNPFRRLEILINLPNRRKIEDEINEIARKNISNDQTSYYLLKKKEAIERKLKDSRGYVSEDIKKILLRLDKEPFPLRIKELVYQKIEQYELLPNLSGEANILRTHINWLMKTPWYETSQEINDLETARQKLDEKHYNLDKVKEKIIEHLAARQRTKESLGQAICLIGLPGIGKTSIASSIAEATGREFVKISLGGAEDVSSITGHRSTYVGAYPGKIVQAMCKAKTINPVILLDEIDKLSRSYRGDPSYALLQVLDPTSNKTFTDDYLGEEAQIDLSKVLFICTANDADQIPFPLLDRLEKIFLPIYTEEEKVEIAKKFLIPLELDDYNLTKEEISFTDDALVEIIRYYTAEAGVRSLKQSLDQITRKFIVELITNKKKKTVVDSEEVKRYLKKRLVYRTSLRPPAAGVFLGLAVNPVTGGSVMPVEVVHYLRWPEEPEVTTGNLEQTMKESCQVALNYVRSNALKFGIKPNFFIQEALHVHCSVGGQPKDGPSAGVAFVTAIISSITNKPVSNKIAATGEISLNGWIGGIGGLKEKLIGASALDLETVIIPKYNVKDLEDVPDSVIKKLSIIPVETYDEVWEILFKPTADRI